MSEETGLDEQTAGRTGVPVGVVTASLAAIVIANAVFVSGSWGGDGIRLIATSVVLASVSAGAVFLLWRASLAPGLAPRSRTAWKLLAAAVAANLVGDLVWLFYEVVLGRDPFPSFADVGYLLYYGFALWGLMSFPSLAGGRVDYMRTALDAITALLAGGLIVYYIVVAPLVAEGGITSVAGVLAVAYPILDLVVLFAAIHVWTHRRMAQRERAIRILTAALFVGMVADLFFAIQTRDGSYTPGGVADLIFTVWIFLCGLAGYAQVRGAEAATAVGTAPGTAAETSLDSRVANLLPYTGVVVGFALLVYAIRNDIDTTLGRVVLGALVLTSVVILRQILSLRERQRAELALRQNQELLQAVIRASPVAVAATDIDENITLWSPAAERIFGWSEEEVLGRPWPAVPPDKREESDAIRDRWRRGEDLGVIDMVRLRKDGSLVEIESRFATLLGANGEVAGSVSVMADVTEERKAQQRLRTLIEAAPMAIIMTDVNENVLLWNPAAERIFGWSEEEVLGRPLPYVSPEMREESEQHRLRSLAGKTEPGLDIRRRRRDGRLIDLQLWSAPLRDAEGRVTGLVGLLMDVTDRRRMEEQLRESQKMEAIGQLAGGIAHDFNNLLTAILGNAELILSGDLDAESTLAEVREIKQAAERAGSLTQQILAFSRRQTLQPRVVPLAALVHGSASLLRRTLGETVDIRFELDPDTGLVEVDPHRFEQVLVNLAVNARDAMAPGGVLTIRTGNSTLDEGYCAAHPGTRPGEYVVLSVSDEGCGMDEDTLSHIFEPFFTTKPLGQGTGLGLSTVHGIVTQSGGSIAVESTPGAGTTFTVYLPRSWQGEQAATESRPSPASRHERQATILVVEDEPVVLALVGRVLTRQGYNVIKASRGADVDLILERLGPGDVDLLLTDVLLPGAMQGTAVAEAVRARCGHVPVLFMSGYPRDVIVREGRVVEGVNLLEKPFSPDVLIERVRECLDGSSPAD